MKLPSLNIFKNNKIQIHELDNNSRDKNLLRQILSSFSFKILSVGIGLALVPILLNKLGQENYGVWSILLTLMQWIAIMDIGIGNGLRNKLTESLSQNKLIDAREYVSTAYISMIVIAMALILISGPLLFYFNWSLFFNSKDISADDLKWSVIIFIFSIIIYFVISLVNQVIFSIQRNALTSIAPIAANILFIIIIVLFFPQHNVKILPTAILYALCLLGSGTVMTLFFFNEYNYLSPKFKLFKKNKIKSILSLGVKFFVLQIACLVIFSTDNVVITQLFGPKAVTTYSVPFVIFHNIGMLINLMMTPFLSSYTEAYSKNNLDWIRSKILLLCKLMLPFILSIAIIVYLFPFLLHLWIKTSITLPPSLPLLMGIYTIVTVWNNIFTYVLNGIAKINLGMYVTIAIAIINIPLSIYLAKYCHTGLNGIILSNIICIGVSATIAPIQVYYFIFTEKSSAKWDRILS